LGQHGFRTRGEGKLETEKNKIVKMGGKWDLSLILNGNPIFTFQKWEKISFSSHFRLLKDERQQNGKSVLCDRARAQACVEERARERKQARCGI